ncbi:hypothetical protein L3X38_035063 [Prunus dulcis]|uniref:Uncharacterized protein n=1 Tax=Prunus dulcis TaxID=3755 RepID=A0AAD4YYG3_PRUDU|nr:hypothetical protein L3X38_035063 [Prunus dulcis]
MRIVVFRKVPMETHVCSVDQSLYLVESQGALFGGSASRQWFSSTTEFSGFQCAIGGLWQVTGALVGFAGRLFSLLFLSGARLLVVCRAVGEESAISFGLGFSWDCSGQLNVDGSHKAAFGNIGAGGVLRNSNGEWLGGFVV